MQSKYVTIDFYSIQNWCTMQAGNPVYCALEYTQSL